MANFNYCIGVDLGGTNIAAGIVDLDSREILRSMSIKTNAPRPYEDIGHDIVDMCRKLCEQQGIAVTDLSWIGIACPGIIKNEIVIKACNLKWENADVVGVIKAETGIPCYLANDANAAAYAEAMWGSGEGCDSLVAITLGTGVGGGIVINGKIWEGVNGFAAELGHTILVPDGKTCACGKNGCVESYCSATALVSATKSLMNVFPESVMWELCGGDLDKVSGKTAFRAQEMGDPCGKTIVNDFVRHLGIAVSNVINTLQPDVVCIGGGISREGDNLLIPLREKVRRYTVGNDGVRTKIVAATFRNDAGIFGAALLGYQKK